MFIIAAAVGTFVVRMWELSYTVALLLAGLAVSVETNGTPEAPVADANLTDKNP